MKKITHNYFVLALFSPRPLISVSVNMELHLNYYYSVKIVKPYLYLQFFCHPPFEVSSAWACSWYGPDDLLLPHPHCQRTLPHM